MKRREYKQRSNVRPRPTVIYEDSRTKRKRTRADQLREDLEVAAQDIEEALKERYR